MTENNISIFQRQLDEAKSSRRTGFIQFGQDAINAGFRPHYYFINGEDVTKETFILDSGMDHLLDDRTAVKCTQCGRHASPVEFKNSCGMSLGSNKCQGIFF
jgi:hypothetical protein